MIHCVNLATLRNSPYPTQDYRVNQDDCCNINPSSIIMLVNIRVGKGIVMKRIFLLVMIAMSTAAAELAQEFDETSTWTWAYTKKFSSQELKSIKQRAHLVFSKTDIAQFTQLIFSWNAFRPEKGHYAFHAQVRDATSKEWGAWHKMMEWGANVQRSFTSKIGDWTQYFHVRLETGTQRLADGFRLKIEIVNGADFSQFRGFSVSVSDFTKFNSEIGAKGSDSWPSIHLGGVPQKSQMLLEHPRCGDMCSPTSSSMLTSYLLMQYVDPLDFAQKAYDSGLNAYGSWPFNTAHAFERCNGTFYFSTRRFASFAALLQHLKQDIPVVVSVRGYLRGAPKAYPKGHLLVVVGFDAQTREVICHDPAFHGDENIKIRYPLDVFLAAWERSHRLAYVAEPASILSS